jgi:hypothetical protein
VRERERKEETENFHTHAELLPEGGSHNSSLFFKHFHAQTTAMMMMMFVKNCPHLFR